MTHVRPAGSRLLVAALLGCVVAPPAASAQAPPPDTMKTYHLVLLYKGTPDPSRGTDTQQLQAAHLQYMDGLHAAGKSVGGGPMTDRGDLRGVLILDVSDPEEAKRLVHGDPAVKAGRLAPVVLGWYGPVGVGREYSERVKADPKTEVPMMRCQFGFLTKGSGWTPEQSAETADLQNRHLAHLSSLVKSGALLAAGPLTGSDRLLGILIFNLPSVEEAVKLASQDPSVVSGRLGIEMHPWLVAEGVIPAMRPW